MQHETVSKNFWESTDFYPNYPFVKERRKYEIDYLLKEIPHTAKSLLDLGCGNGSTVILLRELTYIREYYCYDISQGMLNTIGGNRDSNLHTHVWNGNEENAELPETDVTISMNMLMYVFDDHKVEEIVKSIKSDIFIARISCNTERLVINKFSEEFQTDYSGCYRTSDEYVEIFKKSFSNVTVSRAFPDEIESAYSTKQMFFLCKR
jgi:SAM-dependent methyltransferase